MRDLSAAELHCTDFQAEVQMNKARHMLRTIDDQLDTVLDAIAGRHEKIAHDALSAIFDMLREQDRLEEASDHDDRSVA